MTSLETTSTANEKKECFDIDDVKDSKLSGVKKDKRRNRKNKVKDLNREETIADSAVETINEISEGLEDMHIKPKDISKSLPNKNISSKKTETKTKGSKKQQATSSLAKKLAEAKQLLEQKKREEEERELELERKRQEELQKQLLEEQKKAAKKQKEKERKKRLKEEGKLLSKTQKERKAKGKKSLQQLFQGGATCAAIHHEDQHSNTNTLQNNANIVNVKCIKSSDIVENNKQLETNFSEDSSCDEKNEDSSDNEIKMPHIPDPIQRIQYRMKLNKESINLNRLRAPIICVLGHVDTGKTKILDRLRCTNVQDHEAGGITQQIGVTNVPISVIHHCIQNISYMKDFAVKIGGLAIIDTPGHLSFGNMRSLGSSLCDMSILIVDIMHSIEAQTIESINLLVSKKVPFVVALNKIDLIIDWKSYPNNGIIEAYEKQSITTKQHFESLFKDVFLKFSELGLNIALFDKNPDEKRFISAIPTSARTGDGINDLIAYICKYSQTNLVNQLAKSKELEATIMEVRFDKGLGSTIDVILVNGALKVGDRLIVPGIEGPIVTQIRALLTPQPMREIRVKGTYLHHNCISTSQGIKISAPNLENAMAGLPIFVAHEEDEIEYYKNELISIVHKSLATFKKKDVGVYVVASSLGSLEALLRFLNDSKVPFFGFNIGSIHKKDITTVAIMHEREPMYAVILAFNVKIDNDAKELADQLKVRIFTAEIIYHLLDNYVAYEKQYKEEKATQNKHLAVFPCVLRILPECVFKTRDPIIVGVFVEEGTARIGTPLCVPEKDNLVIGVIGGIENNHKAIEVAKKGQEVCIKIASVHDQSPKLLGRHFEVSNKLVSQITRDSIDIMKKYFRDELTRQDWLLIKDLKSTLNIL